MRPPIARRSGLPALGTGRCANADLTDLTDLTVESRAKGLPVRVVGGAVWRKSHGEIHLERVAVADPTYPPGVERLREPTIDGARGDEWVDAWLISANTETVGSPQFSRSEEGPCPGKAAGETGGTPAGSAVPATWRNEYYTQRFRTTSVYKTAHYTRDWNGWWFLGVGLAILGLILVTVGTFGVGGVLTVTLASGTVLTVSTVAVAGTVIAGTGGIITTINDGDERYQRGTFKHFGDDTAVIEFTAETAPVVVRACP